MSVLVLVGDARGFSRHALFPSRPLRRIACLVVRREGLREDPVSPISPTAVVLDNLVGDRGHVSLLSAPLFVRRGWDANEAEAAEQPAGSLLPGLQVGAASDCDVRRYVEPLGAHLGPL